MKPPDSNLEEWQIQEIQKGLLDAQEGDFASDEEVAAVFAKWQNRLSRVLPLPPGEGDRG